MGRGLGRGVCVWDDGGARGGARGLRVGRGVCGCDDGGVRGVRV